MQGRSRDFGCTACRIPAPCRLPRIAPWSKRHNPRLWCLPWRTTDSSHTRGPPPEQRTLPIRSIQPSSISACLPPLVIWQFVDVARRRNVAGLPAQQIRDREGYGAAATPNKEADPGAQVTFLTVSDSEDSFAIFGWISEHRVQDPRQGTDGSAVRSPQCERRRFSLALRPPRRVRTRTLRTT